MREIRRNSLHGGRETGNIRQIYVLFIILFAGGILIGIRFINQLGLDYNVTSIDAQGIGGYVLRGVLSVTLCVSCICLASIWIPGIPLCLAVPVFRGMLLYGAIYWVCMKWDGMIAFLLVTLNIIGEAMVAAGVASLFSDAITLWNKRIKHSTMGGDTGEACVRIKATEIILLSAYVVINGIVVPYLVAVGN